jgi:23S rRNA pseudouridine955/2504/2580 synthase/23S rRNA pseudouridine1911/1915/1917 synthase
MPLRPSPSNAPNATRSFHAEAAADEQGMTVLAFCRRRWTSYGDDDWQALFARSGLLLNGAPATSEHVVRAGDCLNCTVPVGPEPPACTDFRILYRDAAIAVIDKPGNLPCHPAGRYYANTLERLLIDRGHLPCVHLANRLDRETSGLVLVALSNETASTLGDAFMRREVGKQYIAIVEGEFPDDTRTVAGWLYLARGTTVRRKRVFLPEESPHPDDAQHVETQFRCLARRNGLSWLEVRPATGRPHQIRATLKGIGFPIVGDKLYGVDETIYARLSTDRISALDQTRLRIPRQALHAFRLCFRHPVTGAALVFTSPLPNDLTGL